MSEVPDGASIAQELTDIHRGMHPHCLGYLDAGQIQDLRAADDVEHPAYGTLRGFQETRRVTGILMGPDSAAVFRYGLMGSWQSGGWTKDVYLTTPSDPHVEATRWGVGFVAADVDQDWFLGGGWFHSDPVEWSGDFGYRLSDSREALWGLARYRRAGVTGSVGTGGIQFGRIGLLADPMPFPKYAQRWFLPQLEFAAVWNRADWNPWSDEDAWGGEVRSAFLGDRLSGRLEAGQDGFRLAQMISNLDPEGNIGLDLSWSKARSSDGFGIRVRVPCLTFSWNDPDDAAAFGVSSKGVVWSIRIQMTWETSQGWYRPGRRLGLGGQ